MNSIESTHRPSSMARVRPSAVAGLFYPARASELEHILTDQFRHARPIDQPHQAKALIVPHAGYIYSGSVAASAYQVLQPMRQEISRILLVGPSHRLPFNGIAVSEADFFATPLGEIPVDTAAIECLLKMNGVTMLEEAHAIEHSLEVQLPFLQYMLDSFTIVPVLTGDAEPLLVASVIEQIVDDETLIVISSDLSHYLDYESAQSIDSLTSQAIISMDISDIDSFHACGCAGICGFLHYARQHQLSGTVLDLRNSGDTTGRKDSVVGYGAYLFE